MNDRMIEPTSEKTCDLCFVTRDSLFMHYHYYLEDDTLEPVFIYICTNCWRDFIDGVLRHKADHEDT